MRHMPMYYFHLHDNEDVVDADGTELPNLEAAREHARQVARELTFKRDGMLQRGWSQWTMSVQDNDGQILLSFPLGDFERWSTASRDHANPTSIKKNPSI
jgi:hypothetical protein